MIIAFALLMVDGTKANGGESEDRKWVLRQECQKSEDTGVGGELDAVA